jgi:hypothetical protein
MSRITAKLSRLRGLFIAYFMALIIVDVLLGWDLIRGSLGSWRDYRLDRSGPSQGGLFILILSGAGLLFALGLWLFRQLIRRKSWARVVLLVVGWLTVIDAALSLLITSRATGFTPWLTSLTPGLDWHRAILVDRIKDLIGLLFWGYLVWVLQIAPDVKRDFLEPPHAPGPETAGPSGPEDGR